jgi:fumarate hydratase class I
MEEIIRSPLFDKALSELIFRTATELPEDVVNSLKQARENEEEGSTARLILTRYLDNLELASKRKAPLCQDTGLPVFYITLPECMPRETVRDKIGSALTDATRRQYLRPNAVDPITGKNSGNNQGTGFPAIYFHDGSADNILIDLILKGGGSENVSAQYSLPFNELDAGRDFEGVRRVVLDAVVQAGGKGCPPGILGVCIGGDRESGYREAKKQFLRRLDDQNPDERMGALEQRLFDDINRLGIGPQGLGGKTTVLGVKVSTLYRVPASYFVTVSYMCWAFRRRRLTIGKDGDFRIE